MLKFYALILSVFLIACGSNQSREVQVIRGAQGPQGVPGPQGMQGQAALQPSESVVNVQASRTYSPDGYQDYTTFLPAGVWSVPDEIIVNKGYVGQGWLSVIMGEVNYCYQGVTTDNAQEFRYRGVKAQSESCDGHSTAGPHTAISYENMRLKVSVTGGGCDTHCLETAVVFQVTGRPFFTAQK